MKKLRILSLIFLLCLSTAMPLYAEGPQASLEGEAEETEEVLEIKVSETNYELEEHASYNLHYEVNRDVPVEFKVVKPEVLSIDSEGTMTGKKPGKTEVILEAKDGEELATNSVFVTVYAAEEEGKVFFDQEVFYLIRNLSYQIPYQLEGKVNVKDLVWRSSNPSVATVENGIVYGHRIGETIIEAHAPDNKASMKIHVTAPLEAIEFNLDRLEMEIFEEQTMPELVYRPYDTTSSKQAKFWVEDPEILAIEGASLVAKKIGKTKLFAKVNQHEAALEVEVKAPKTSTGASILTLDLIHDENLGLSLKHDDLNLYDGNRFVLKWPIDEILEKQKKQHRLDLNLFLDAKLYHDQALERFLLPAELLKDLRGDQSLHIHLYDHRERHILSYHFHHRFDQSIHLKHRIEKVEQVDKGRFKLPEGSYLLEFEQKQGFPSGTQITLPKESFEEDYGLYFVYLKDDQNLIDLEKTLDLNKTPIQMNIEEASYILSPTKLSSVSDRVIIWTLALTFLFFVIFIVYRYSSVKD